MRRSYYSNSIINFLQDSDESIVGQIASKNQFSTEILQRNAWMKQIEILKNSTATFKCGHLFFEFQIPRMGKRVDNILIYRDLFFVLEFKVGEKEYKKHAIDQVMDYCLDLKNFHQGSHNEKLIPILVSTNAPAIENVYDLTDNLCIPLKANRQNLHNVILKALEFSTDRIINPCEWENSSYKPTPTIIEASQALYRGHSVEEISRSDSGKINLSKTTQIINRIIESSKQEAKKSICFLTGVPGAGKTLAGLNIANERRKAHEDENAVFLSGNGPLVDVLREALVRDEVSNEKAVGNKITKKESAIKANAFIQNIHHFRDENLQTNVAPDEKVVVFDEAQRAWTKEKTQSFMKQRNEDFDKSEPEFLIGVMNRHEKYCTIICLVGGGQEINTGEAGISEWIKALRNGFPDWNVYYSSLITTDKNYLEDDSLKNWLIEKGKQEADLHLAVCVRSFRSEKVSNLVHEIIEGNSVKAKAIYQIIKDDFPITVTRDFSQAKFWLKKKAKGTERIGLLASSGGRRLRPLGIDVKNEFEAKEWFLNESDDVRSSYYLENVATEFDIQGLEIDYACVAWDINFYFDNGHWNYQSLKERSGTRLIVR